MPYVYSTRTKSHNITNWVKRDKDDGRLPQKTGSVMIHGGANIPNHILVVPEGVVTKISDAELEICEQNHVFQKHIENGTFVVRKSEARKMEKVVEDMEPKDSAAPASAPAA